MLRPARRKTRLLPALLLLFAGGCSHTFAGGWSHTTLGIDAASIAHDVAWLADAERHGRGLGSEGLDEAAQWLAQNFAEAGFQGGGPDGSFLQRFEVPVSIGVKGAALRFDPAGAAPPLERGRDFEALLASTSGELPGEVVFAGFGISDEETGWDDYAELDVTGKTVLVLDGRPGEETDEPLGDGRGAVFTRPAYKLLNARRHGAAAVLIAPARSGVPGLPGVGGLSGANPSIQDAGILAMSLSREAAERMVAGGGQDLDRMQSRSEQELVAGGSALPGVALHGRVDIAREQGEVANVVAVLPGTDPALADEAVVIGAHYDHLGEGNFGSLSPGRRGELHLGADDNASGTAALLALARSFAKGSPPRRTLILIAFTAEEAGLLGSAYYVSDPLIPMADTVAMINLDMVGRLRDDRVVTFGSESGTGLEERVERAARPPRLRVEYQNGAMGPSDQTSFASQQVPVLFFFTGTHPDYHTPDDRPERVNADGIARVAALTAGVARELLDSTSRPEFAATVSGHGGNPSSGGGGGYGPSLGTVPAFGGEPVEGVRLSGVRPGSPAETAGLKAGDVIVGFAGSEVRNLEEFAALLFSQVPGREVEVIVERDGERIVTRATLGQRR